MDISLYYEERGEGFPLVLLHGNGESHEYFARQMEPFSRVFRVLAPDTRGHGRSPRGEGAFTLRRFADDLYDFLRARGIERAHILGFSDGGNIALYFALAHPEMVDHLILNGANLRPAGVRRRYQLPIEIGYKIAKRFAGKNAGARPRRDAGADGERAGHFAGAASRADHAHAGGRGHKGHDSPFPYGRNRKKPPQCHGTIPSRQPLRRGRKPGSLQRGGAGFSEGIMDSGSVRW